MMRVVFISRTTKYIRTVRQQRTHFCFSPSANIAFGVGVLDVLHIILLVPLRVHLKVVLFVVPSGHDGCYSWLEWVFSIRMMEALDLPSRGDCSGSVYQSMNQNGVVEA